MTETNTQKPQNRAVLVDGTSNGRSAGTQAEDALEMKKIYQGFLPEQ